MTKKQHYKYIGEDGEVVSPVLLPMAHTDVTRLIAEDGMEIVKDGVSFGSTLDVTDDEGYTEQAIPERTEA